LRSRPRRPNSCRDEEPPVPDLQEAPRRGVRAVLLAALPGPRPRTVVQRRLRGARPAGRSVR
jgi:hypothetical protein